MLEVRLLGQFEVLRDGRRITIPTRNAQSLFAYLLLNAGKAHRREKLAGLLWPNSSEENARSNLRHELWRLRKALESEEEAYFEVDDLTIAFSPPEGYFLDLNRLESASLEGGTADDLIEALSNYQGELLPGFYDEWVFVERDRLNALFEAKIARLLEILQSEARWTEVFDWGNRWIGLGGWPEPAYRALMSAYANTGDISKAVATYERYAQALQREMGMKPSEQTQALYKRLKAGWKSDVRLATPTPVTQPPVSTSDLSTPNPHLLKMRRSNLPRPLTSFIGREKEMQQVVRLVSSARLVTITGSGGVGKTRLAIQVADALLPQFKDGVWWVELASLFEITPSKKQDLSNYGSLLNPMDALMTSGGHVKLSGADLIAQAVAKVLRVPEMPGQPLIEVIVEYLQDKQLLLILDNCEHLIEACSALVERLLSNCPGMTILATSREALGVPGEKAWLLPSLTLPGGGPVLGFRDILQSEAVSLFIERTVDILPGYKLGELEASTIAQVCLRLDGIPLAIELAAARMNLLSAQEIAARLDDRFNLLTGGRRTALPRHQTLWSAIEWSYDLLEENERMFFRRLSVFAGSFTLEAAEAICAGEGIHGDKVLTLLGRLLDKSLLYVEPAPRDPDLATRYRFLDTIRSFARLKLDESGESGRIRDRHAEYYVLLVETVKPERWLHTLRNFGLALMFDRRADYYVRLIEAARPELNLHNQLRLIKLLQAENDNLRAVVEWGAESGQAESALRLVGALLWYWYYFGSPLEGRDLALKILASPSAMQYRTARARALNTSGYLQLMLGDITLAKQELEEALSILRSSDDETSLAWSLQFLGFAYSFNRDYELADAAFREGLSIAGKLGDADIQSFSFILGDIYLQKGDRSNAKKIYEESVNFQRVYGNKAFLAYPLRRLGYLALEQDDVPKAWSYLKESLTLNHEIGDKPGLAACLTSMSVLAMYLEKPVVAARLYGVAKRQLESFLINLLYLDMTELGRIRDQLQENLDEATFEAAFAEGWEMSEEQAIELVGAIIEEEA